MCSIIYYGNIIKDATSYQFTLYISYYLYCPTVIEVISCFCQRGATCQSLLVDLISGPCSGYASESTPKQLRNILFANLFSMSALDLVGIMLLR